MKNSVIVVWLEGVNPTLLSSSPSVAKIAAKGVDLKLMPLPLAEQSVCGYQLLTGMGSGKFGHFDAVRPEGYTVQREENVPDGALGRLLPDILRSYKLNVLFQEVQKKEAFKTLLEQKNDCGIIRFLGLEHASIDEIDDIVQLCVKMVAPETHLVVLTDVWQPQPHALVNVNDFLADIGLLEVGTPRTREGILWTDSLAYGLGTGQIWVNLRGREPQGIVGSGAEYQKVCEALINELCSNWLDPRTNSPVVAQVLKKEDAYTGEYLFKAPDLVIVYRPGYSTSSNATFLDFDGESVREVNTSSDAIAPYAQLIAGGPCLVSGFAESCSLVDVMPSLLYLLGQPIPHFIDGQVISSMFTSSYRQQTPLKVVEDESDLLSEEEEGLVVDRLRDLGYLG